MENEIYKPIEGYKGLYEISNLGNVKSLNYRRTGKKQILKPIKGKDGYLRISLNQNGNTKLFLVHRLVSIAFLSNPNNYSDVNHIDENKENNRVENLEWCTRQYNCNYGTHNERVAKSLSIPIVQLTKNGEYIATYQSATQVERELGFNNGNINSCCKKRKNYKTAHGYKWMYLSDYQKAI